MVSPRDCRSVRKRLRLLQWLLGSCNWRTVRPVEMFNVRLKGGTPEPHVETGKTPRQSHLWVLSVLWSWLPLIRGPCRASAFLDGSKPLFSLHPDSDYHAGAQGFWELHRWEAELVFRNFVTETQRHRAERDRLTSTLRTYLHTPFVQYVQTQLQGCILFPWLIVDI